MKTENRKGQGWKRCLCCELVVTSDFRLCPDCHSYRWEVVTDVEKPPGDPADTNPSTLDYLKAELGDKFVDEFLNLLKNVGMRPPKKDEDTKGGN